MNSLYLHIICLILHNHPILTKKTLFGLFDLEAIGYNCNGLTRQVEAGLLVVKGVRGGLWNDFWCSKGDGYVSFVWRSDHRDDHHEVYWKFLHLIL